MCIYRFLADMLVVIHALYASFVVLGLVVVLWGWARQWRWIRNFWFRAVHLAMIGIVVAESLGGVVCPLTTWENDLRWKAGDDSAYAGSFIGHWVHEALFLDVPSYVLDAAYCLFGLAVLAALILAPPRWPWAKRPRGPTMPQPGA